MIQGLPKIRRQGTFEGYRFRTRGVEKSEIGGVQELPGETERITLTTPVKGVPDKGVPYRLEMGTDLMGHTGPYLHLYKTEASRSGVRSELG